MFLILWDDDVLHHFPVIRTTHHKHNLALMVDLVFSVNSLVLEGGLVLKISALPH